MTERVQDKPGPRERIRQRGTVYAEQQPVTYPTGQRAENTDNDTKGKKRKRQGRIERNTGTESGQIHSALSPAINGISWAFYHPFKVFVKNVPKKQEKYRISLDKLGDYAAY